jgi:hypothetical protein
MSLHYQSERTIIAVGGSNQEFVLGRLLVHAFVLSIALL